MEDETRDAGSFGGWLDALTAATRDGVDVDVPCDACTACCTSSQFIPIGPDEVATLARVPRALRFPAPGAPPGHVVLGHDDQGRCPMFVDGACSIYADRPRACRTYDCRVLAAVGIEPESWQPELRARVRSWRFAVDDRSRWEEVRASVPLHGPPLARALVALDLLAPDADE